MNFNFPAIQMKTLIFPRDILNEKIELIFYDKAIDILNDQ